MSESGKSRFLAHLCLSYLERGLPVTLIDPHGDLARLVLMLLIAEGVYSREQAYERILYLDLPAAERQGRFMPFNVLNRQGKPDQISSQIASAMHRAFPELAAGAPRFDKLIQHGIHVLVCNNLPLPFLPKLLYDSAFREMLLRQETEAGIVELFRGWFDSLHHNYRNEYIDSTVSRVQLLNFHSILKYSLGQQDLLFNFRHIMDRHQSVILNLAVDDERARKLLGCLLTVLAEQGAKSRADMPPESRKGTHLLVIDEAPEFTDHSEITFTRMLSETRKYGLHLAFCHQTLSQVPERLLSGLQNAGVTVAFGAGRDDSEYFGKIFGRFEAKTTRTDFREEHKSESVGLREQQEEITLNLYDQWQREAWVSINKRKRPSWLRRRFFKPKPRKVAQVLTPEVRYPKLPPGALEKVESEYLRRYFRLASAAVQLPDFAEAEELPQRRGSDRAHLRKARDL